MRTCNVIFSAAVACGFLASMNALAEDASAELDVNRANDPFELSPELGYRQINIFEFGDADLNGAAIYRVRYTHPIKATDDVPEQLIRVTTAVKTKPDPASIYINSDNEWRNSDTTTGLGDTTIFDTFTLGYTDNAKWGIGPNITIPTHEDDIGNDNWRAGVTGITMYRFTPSFQFTGLMSWSKNFSGSDEDTHKISFQPIVNYTFSNHWVLFSGATWVFDLENDTHYIPVGVALGKLFQVDGNLYSVFVEPTWTLDADDTDRDGNFKPQPEFFVRIGVSVFFIN